MRSFTLTRGGFGTAAALASILLPSLVSAQTSTDCNPMNATCPVDPALGTNATFQFNETMPSTSLWEPTAGTVEWTDDGGEFIINGEGDSPTLMSTFYLFFGTVSVVMKAASGQGIVSSIVLESDDLDEVDWEFVGGNGTHVETNYFGKGNTTSYDRAIWHPLDDDPRDGFHNYTIVWTNSSLSWYVDDTLLRTLNREDALDGYNYPQTPMNIRLGIWSGGDPEKDAQGTIEWAQGETDFDEAPFTMTVQSVYAEDANSGKSYNYTDHSGMSYSIEVINGTSTAKTKLTTPQTVAERWAALSSTARGAIIGCSCGGAALLAAGLAYACVRQRRAGRKQHCLLEEERRKEEAENEFWRGRLGGETRYERVQD